MAGHSPAIAQIGHAIHRNLLGILDEHLILAGMAVPLDSSCNLPKRPNPTIVAFVAGLNLVLFLIGTICAWAALSIAKSLGGRFLLVLTAVWCVAVPCGFVWVTFRRRWKTGCWQMTEKERLEARATLGIGHDARLMQDKDGR